MVAQFAAELYRACSVARLERYRPPGGTDLEMLTTYFWNIDLAVALLPSLNAAEIALRNAIHSAFEVYFNNPLWFYEPELLEPNQLSSFASAYRSVTNRTAVTPGLLVAELSFGFWTSLLSRKYLHVWSSNTYSAYHNAFPGAQNVPFDQVGRRFNEIRALRNRVAHHEPIVFRPNLAAEHRDIHQAIEWISPSLCAAIRLNDGFSTVYGSRASVERRLKDHLRLP